MSPVYDLSMYYLKYLRYELFNGTFMYNGI